MQVIPHKSEESKYTEDNKIVMVCFRFAALLLSVSVSWFVCLMSCSDGFPSFSAGVVSLERSGRGILLSACLTTCSDGAFVSVTFSGLPG